MSEEILKPVKNLRQFKVATFAAFALLVLLFITSGSLLYMKLQDNAIVARQNQGYVRYIACVADIRNEQNVLAVSDEISDACWRQAEIETGISLPRYSEKVILDSMK